MPPQSLSTLSRPSIRHARPSGAGQTHFGHNTTTSLKQICDCYVLSIQARGCRGIPRHPPKIMRPKWTCSTSLQRTTPAAGTADTFKMRRVGKFHQHTSALLQTAQACEPSLSPGQQLASRACQAAAAACRWSSCLSSPAAPALLQTAGTPCAPQVPPRPAAPVAAALQSSWL